MEIFYTLKVVLRYLRIKDNDDFRGRVISAMIRFSGFFSLFFFATASSLFIFFAAENFGSRAEAIMAVIGGYGNFGMYALLLWYRHQILDLIADIEDTIAASMCSVYSDAEVIIFNF